MYPLPNAPAYPNHSSTGLFANSTGCVTPFVCWIEDYPLPDGLKISSHMRSYDGKGDLDNYLHLFEGAIRVNNSSDPVIIKGYLQKASQPGERQKKLKESPSEVTKGVLSCVDAEERIVVNDKYPEQMVIIVKQLPPTFKKRLQDLLRLNADIFAWTYTDMMGIPRTIMVGGKPFNTKHKLNEYKHIKPVKQKKRGLGVDRSEAACKEVEELMNSGIL
ncbi:hypothetical protein Tco_0412764 [Tanacetum coccineum]